MAPPVQGSRPRVAPGHQHNAQTNAYGFSRKTPRTANITKRRVIPHLNIESDKEGQRAWREKKAPNDSEVLPSGFDPDQELGSFESFRFIQATTGTHMALRKQKGPTENNCWVVEIWGTDQQVREAKQAIHGYLARMNSKDNKAFAKVVSELRAGANQQALHDKLRREQKRQKFCQKLSEAELTAKKYAYSIAVPWSEDKWQVEDALGQQLEALDEIRMNSMCYIHLSRSRNGTSFLLLGEKHEKMMDAAHRLQGIPARILSHAMEKTQLFLVKPLPTPLDYSAFELHHVDYHRPLYIHEQHRHAVDDPDGKYLQLRASGSHDSMFLDKDYVEIRGLDEIAESGAVWMGLKHASFINSQYLHLWMTQALTQLAVYRGYISMEISIGTCVFERYKPTPTVSMTQFEEMVFEANTGEAELQSFIAANLNAVEGQKLLECFFSCQKQFLFYGATYNTSSTATQLLQTCQPILKAASVIKQESGDHLRLEQEFKMNTIGDFVETDRRWLRIKDEPVAPAGFVDINLVDLEDPGLSCNLNISRCDILDELREDRLKSVYHQFANKVQPNKDTAKNITAIDKRLFDVPATGTGKEVNLIYHEQTRSWLFSAWHHPGYYVEVYAKTEVDITRNDQAQSDSAHAPLPRKEQWGVKLWHERWTGLFKQNRELGIGRKTTWQPTEAQFFPSQGYLDAESMEGTEAEDGAGFAALMSFVRDVEDMAKGSRHGARSGVVAAAQPTAVAVIPHGSAETTSNGGPPGLPVPDLLGDEQTSTTMAQLHLGDGSGDDAPRDEPNTKKKRLNTATAKRTAALAALDKPKSSADVRSQQDKCFADIDAKLHAQTAHTKSASNKPAASRRRGKKQAGSQQAPAASPLKEIANSTNGSWLEQDGPKGSMPKLPKPSGVTARAHPPVRAPIPAPTMSWANVAKGPNSGGAIAPKQKLGALDNFPALGSKKK